MKPSEVEDTAPVPSGWRCWLFNLHLATVFLTRLPLPGPAVWGSDALARAMAIFPVIGAAVGTIGGIVFWGCAAVGLAPSIGALLAITAMVLLTGGLHEDGLADTADGFGGGGNDPVRKLAIMRDSRQGSFGVLALILSVGLRAAAIAAIAEPSRVLLVMVVAGAFSRAAMPLAMHFCGQPARRDGLGQAAGESRWRDTVAAILIAIAVTALVALPVIPVLVAMIAATAAVSITAKRQIGGYTGDVLGTAGQIVEVAVLLVLAR